MPPRLQISASQIGILCAFLASVGFSITDLSVKLLSGNYPLHQIIFIRSIVALALTLAIIIPLEGGYVNLKTRRPIAHLIRGICLVSCESYVLRKSSSSTAWRCRSDIFCCSAYDNGAVGNLPARTSWFQAVGGGRSRIGRRDSSCQARTAWLSTRRAASCWSRLLLFSAADCNSENRPDRTSINDGILYPACFCGSERSVRNRFLRI